MNIWLPSVHWCTVISVTAITISLYYFLCLTLTLACFLWTAVCWFPPKLDHRPRLRVFGCCVINLEHLQTVILFYSGNCLRSCSILMFWAQLGICAGWKGSADMHSASCYRLCSPRADTHPHMHHTHTHCFNYSEFSEAAERNWCNIFFWQSICCLPSAQQTSFSVRRSPFWITSFSPAAVSLSFIRWDI